ncbi:MAG: ATPase domain-containing protein, partial [Candidatus Gracilibacteria bacterium]
MRLKTIFVCQSCAAQSPKWVGKCPQCNAWNSLIEDTIRTDTPAKERQHRNLQTPIPTPLSETLTNVERTPTGIQEFDRVLGGGLVNGSLLLLGGEPGIGKSTLTLELCEGISKSKSKILYISGEESVAQIALRAKRLGVRSEKLLLVNETFLEPILALLDQQKPDFAIIDSIQVMSTQNAEGMAGGVTQVRACAEALMEHVKSKNMSLLIVSHVTKDGNLAGPKTLEHLVDTVLYLEGDRYHDLR